MANFILSAIRHFGFYELEILSAYMVQRFSVCYHAKFHGDRSTLCWDMAIFVFLPHDAMLVRYMLSSSVCLSICLSVTRRYCTKTTKHKIHPRRVFGGLW